MFPNLLVQQQFEKMLQTGQLYIVDISGKDPTKEQLCGIGFNATIADELIAMVDNKIIKIVF